MKTKKINNEISKLIDIVDKINLISIYIISYPNNLQCTSFSETYETLKLTTF